MRRSLLVRATCVAAAVAALVALAPAATAATAAPSDGIVTGVVTGIDGRPLQGVAVDMSRYFIVGAFPPQIETYATDVTDARGAYRLRVPADNDQGALLMQFRATHATGGTSATGYTDRCYGGGSDCLWGSKPGKAFTIVAGRTRSGVDVTLGRAGEIRGRLTDAQGRGVGGFPVEFAVGFPSPSDFPENYQRPAVSTVTDVNGNYRLPQLPIEPSGVCFGHYFAPAGTAGTPARDGYASQCVQGVTPVAGRVTTRNLTLTGRGAFVGKVVDADGNPVGGASITSFTGAADGIPRFTTTSAADGTFRLQIEAGQSDWCVNGFSPNYVCSDAPLTVRPYRATPLGTIVLPRNS